MKDIIRLENPPKIISTCAVVGNEEKNGPMGDKFLNFSSDDKFGKDTWEKAESVIHSNAVTRAISKAGLSPEECDVIFAGDLLSQCSGTCFGVRDIGIPLMGVYGACSTMSLSLAAAAFCAETGCVNAAVASTSSHFCSAEKQFRMPLEYGGQRTPTAQWTATAAGAAVVAPAKGKVRIEQIIIGRIQDYGVKDPNNMGAAMAPVDVKLTP